MTISLATRYAFARRAWPELPVDWRACNIYLRCEVVRAVDRVLETRECPGLKSDQVRAILAARDEYEANVAARAQAEPLPERGGIAVKA